MDINIEIIVAFLAFLVSIPTAFATLLQARKTEESLEQQQGLFQANTLLHFTQAYFQIMDDHGYPDAELLADKIRRDKYWAVHSSEFYFFHHGVIPQLMYALWMVDMADFYFNYPEAWSFHKQFLEHYKELYPEMKDFFNGIYNISKIQEEQEIRHRKVDEFVQKWIHENKRDTMS